MTNSLMRWGLTPGGLLALAGILVPLTETAAQAPDAISGPATAPAEPSFRLPDDRLGLRVSPLLLLSREDVAADLKLNPAQTASAQQAIGELHAQAQELRGKTGPEVVAARRQVDMACSGWIQTWLTEEQQARLAQIDLQWEGPAALITRPTVADSLKMSDDQVVQLRRSVEARNLKRAQGAPTLEAERLLAEEVLAALKPAQREQWKAKLGEVFRPNINGQRDAELRAAKAEQAVPPPRP
jgi:hypothetical protein